jgi:hypothetical protein
MNASAEAIERNRCGGWLQKAPRIKGALEAVEGAGR